MNKITSMKQDRLSIKLKRFKLNGTNDSNDEERLSEDEEQIADKGMCTPTTVQRSTHKPTKKLFLQYNYWTIHQRS